MTDMNWMPVKDPWGPADYNEDVLFAIRALREGKAMPHQQTLAWAWLMYLTKAGDGFDDLSFRPGDGGQRATDFAEGKRFVGLQVRKMLHDRTLEAVRSSKPSKK